MTMLTAIMATLSVTLLLIMIPKIYGSWLQINQYSEEGDTEKLISLQIQHNEWVIRHLCMAVMAVGIVTAIKYLPELEVYSQTAAVTAIYCAISFTLAFIESLLAQKISTITTLALQPAKEKHKGNRIR